MARCPEGSIREGNQHGVLLDGFPFRRRGCSRWSHRPLRGGHFPSSSPPAPAWGRPLHGLARLDQHLEHLAGHGGTQLLGGRRHRPPRGPCAPSAVRAGRGPPNDPNAVEQDVPGPVPSWSSATRWLRWPRRTHQTPRASQCAVHPSGAAGVGFPEGSRYVAMVQFTHEAARNCRPWLVSTCTSPFCARACTYCDFHFTTRLSDRQAMVEALIPSCGPPCPHGRERPSPRCISGAGPQCPRARRTLRHRHRGHGRGQLGTRGVDRGSQPGRPG